MQRGALHWTLTQKRSSNGKSTNVQSGPAHSHHSGVMPPSWLVLCTGLGRVSPGEVGEKWVPVLLYNSSVNLGLLFKVLQGK